MDASKVMPTLFAHHEGGDNRPHYEPIRIQCENALVDKGKYNKFSIIQDELITLYIFHKPCLYESKVLSNNNSPKCMIIIVLESVKK